MRLVKAGALNDELIALMCENVRTPFELRGDLLSYITANDTAGRHLNGALDDLGLDDLESEAEAILSRSRIADEDAIAQVPKGSWSHRILELQPKGLQEIPAGEVIVFEHQVVPVMAIRQCGTGAIRMKLG